MVGRGWVLGAAVMLVPTPPLLAETPGARAVAGPEIAVGLLDHGVRLPWTGAPPAGFSRFEGEEERGTADVQIVYRTAPVAVALRPRLTARLQVNTGGRTSFASLGAEWRQHVLRGRVYGQAGIGVAVHDGHIHPADPFAPGLAPAEAARRYAVYSRHTAFGSRVLFNPNLSLGVRIGDRWAVEAAFEHFSHAQIFGKQNPGIETIGLRLVRRLSR